jgi:predicted MPP superfamily phosphohydrolase
LTAGVAVVGYTWRIEPHWVEVVRRELPIAHLPESLIGRTLVQISDLHVGPVVDEGYISAAVKQASSLVADILAITGDVMTYHCQEQIDQTARVLQNLRPGKLATVGVFGNHDYGLYWSQGEVADQLAVRLTDLGIHVLRNTRLDVQGLQVVGLDDLWGTQFEPQNVMPALDNQRAAIVLCHNPDAVDQPVWSGYRGWILSGHTHGGQCKPPFFAPPLLPVSNKRYTAGEFDLFDGRKLYINRGLGYLRRVRFNVRPEITVFTLKRSA